MAVISQTKSKDVDRANLATLEISTELPYGPAIPHPSEFTKGPEVIISPKYWQCLLQHCSQQLSYETNLSGNNREVAKENVVYIKQ